MKKLVTLLAVLIMMLVVSTAYAGSAPDWTITALNTTTPVAIELPANTKCGSISVYTSDGSAVYISKDVAKTDERPWPSGALGETWTDVCAVSGTLVVFYARAATGTPNLILLYQTVSNQRRAGP